MRRVLYLARHGETDWNRDGRWQGHTDVALNDVGRVQARVLAQRLHGLGIKIVYASDLARARETAEIVAAALGVPDVVVDAQLRERSFGIFEGLTRAECAARFPEHWTRYRADVARVPPGAEAHEALAQRMQAAFLRAATEGTATGDEAPALIVSHGGSIRALIARATGQSPPPLDNVAVFRVVAGSTGLVDAVLLT